MKKIFKTLMLASAMVGMACFISCSEGNDDVAPSSPQTDNIDYDKLATSAINEFLDFAKTPRLGLHLDKAQAYIMNWAQAHGYECHTDEAQNVWFDVPATKGMEARPKVILQAHMDMICASAAGESYDYTQVVGEPYYDGDLLKGRKVNLGADDGSGVGMILALVNSEVPHGALRILVTTNEDYGMKGAAALNPDVLDADYLINVDNECLGDIAIGCYGGLRKTFSKTYQTTSSAGNMKLVSLEVDGLKGGHSGLDIGCGRLSASVVLDEIISNVVLPMQGLLTSIDCGSYANAIPSHLTLRFAVDNGDADAAKAKMETLIDNYKRSYPDEKGAWILEVTDVNAGEELIEAQAVSDVNYLFAHIAQGVIEKDNAADRITKSNNIGVVKLCDGTFSLITFARSDYGSWLEEEGRLFDELAAHANMTLQTNSNSPAWESDGQDDLSQLMAQCHNEVGVENKLTKVAGGLETAYFSTMKPQMKCVSVGPTIDNAHSIDEALHVSTVKPLMQVLAKVLMNLGK